MSSYFSKRVVAAVAAFLVFFTAAAAPLFGQIVQVSPAGSYSTSFPTVSGQGGGMPPQPEIWKTSNLTGATPTNDWSSSVLWMQYSERMYADPMSVWAKNLGLEIHYAKKAVKNSGQLNEPIIERLHPESGADVYVQNTGFTPNSARADKISDWAIDILMGNGSKDMVATVGHGSPYVYFTLHGTTQSDKPRLVFGAVPDVFYNGGNYLGVTVNGNSYGIFAPAGSTWMTGGDSKTVEITLAAGKAYFSVALLPEKSSTALNYYRKFAYSFVTDTNASFTFNADQNLVTSTFTPTISVKENVDGVAYNRTLMSLYPHQWRFNNSIAPSLTSYAYQTLRGPMKVIEATSFNAGQKYNGILPWMPLPQSFSGYSETTLRNYIDAEAAKTDAQLIGGPLGGDKIDSYSTGKIFNRLAQLAAVARQINHSAADRFLNIMTSFLEDWLVTDQSELTNDNTSRQMLYYDTNWRSFIGMPTGYYADANLNDHHFHYGYWVYAAAQKALRDPAWGNTWKNMINIVLNEYAGTVKNDPNSPYLRNFDPYAGHSWADGRGMTAHGNNQESSSEALNAYAAMILWGEATGNTTIRDYGIWLYTTEIAAVQNYWFDIYGDVLEPEYNRTEATVQYGGMYAHLIFWEGGPEQIHGINFLPLTGASLYLGYDTAYLDRNISAIAGEVQAYKDRGVYTNNMANATWSDINGATLALVDPARALSFWNSGNAPEYGETKAHTYHWIYSLKTYGQVDTTVRARNHTLYAVFHNGSARNYVVYNPGTSAKTVQFTDGFSMNVAAGTMATASGTIAVLNPPSGINVTADDKIAFVSWNAVDGATGYSIRYTAGSTTQTRTVDGNTTSTFIEGLTNGTNYQISVASTNYGGTGSYSANFSATPLARTSAPSAPVLQSAASGDASLTLTWTRSAGATWYMVKYGTVNGTYQASINTGYTSDAQYTITGLENSRIYYVAVAAANSAGESALSNQKTAVPGVMSSYEKGVTEQSTSQAQVWIDAGDAQIVEMFSTLYGGGRALVKSGNTWSTTLTGLSPNTSFTFWFNVISSAGVGDASELTNRYTYVFGGDDKPNPPTNLVSTSVGQNSVSLQWTASTSPGISSYTLYNGNGTVRASGITGTGTTVSGLSAWTDYSFYVTATRTDGKVSNPSNTLTVKTSDTTAPTVPGNVVSGTITTSSIQVSWTASTDNGVLSGYKVYLNDAEVSSNTTTTTYTFTGLAAGTSYKINVTAFDAAGNVSAKSADRNYSTTAAQVAAPSFNPAPGTYTSAQSVTLSSSTSGATIRYTTDGSNPTSSSPVYSGAISVASSTTIKAYASKSGMIDSAVSTGAYTINIVQQVSAPTFNPAPGTYSSAQSVTLASSTSGATIRYTTDGSNPTSSSPVYSGAISVASSTTIKAYASKSGMTDSAISTGAYTIQVTGDFTQNLSISGSTLSFTFNSNVNSSWVDVHYYTSKNGGQQNFRMIKSGNTHTHTSTTSPALVSGDTVTYFYTYEKATLAYDTSNFVQTVGGTSPVQAPTFSPAGGTYTSTQSVTLSSATSGATIRYTLDGSTPTSSSPIYSTALSIASTTTIKAYATKSGMSDSSVSTATFTINVQTAPAAPTGLSVSGGTSGVLNLAWTDNAGNETGYRVFRSTTNTKPGTALATIAANSVSHQSTGLTNGTTYYFWVEAYNSAGTSAAATASGVPSAGSTPLAIDNFNSAANWNNHVNSLGKSITLNGGLYNLEGDANLYFFYNGGTNPEGFTEQITQSLSGYSNLVLVIKGGNGGEQTGISLVLNDGSDHSVPLSSYGTVTTAYKTISIPLSAFGANLGNIAYLRFEGRGNAKIVRIDEIRVE